MSLFDDELEAERDRFHKRLADTFDDIQKAIEQFEKNHPAENARITKEKQAWQAVGDWLGDPTRALKHVGGRGHTDQAYAGGTVCWCGQDHGIHNQLGGATCWCGTFNKGAGVPR